MPALVGEEPVEGTVEGEGVAGEGPPHLTQDGVEEYLPGGNVRANSLPTVHRSKLVPARFVGLLVGPRESQLCDLRQEYGVDVFMDKKIVHIIGPKDAATACLEDIRDMIRIWQIWERCHREEVDEKVEERKGKDKKERITRTKRKAQWKQRGWINNK